MCEEVCGKFQNIDLKVHFFTFYILRLHLMNMSDTSRTPVVRNSCPSESRKMRLCACHYVIQELQIIMLHICVHSPILSKNFCVQYLKANIFLKELFFLEVFPNYFLSYCSESKSGIHLNINNLDYLKNGRIAQIFLINILFLFVCLTQHNYFTNSLLFPSVSLKR